MSCICFKYVIKIIYIMNKLNAMTHRKINSNLLQKNIILQVIKQVYFYIYNKYFSHNV